MPRRGFKSKATGKIFEVIKQDPEKGVITLKGDYGAFEQEYSKELFKKLGYEMVTLEEEAARETTGDD